MSEQKLRAVEVRAEIRQLKTMADGSLNLTLNLGEDCLNQAGVLLGWLGLEVRAVIERVERHERRRGG